MAIKTIRVFAEYTSDGYVPMPSQGNIDYGVTVGSTFPETQPSSFQTDDPNIDVAVTTMTDFYVWIRTHGSAWNPNYTRVVRVYPDSPSINSVVMNMIVAVGGGGTTISSGGGVNYYLNGGTSQGVLDGSTYYEMNKVPVEGTGVDFFKINTTGFENIAQFVTDAGDPGLLNIPAGNWPLGFYMSASDNSGAPKFYAEIYKYSAAGVFTLLGSNVTAPEVITNGQAIDYYTTNVTIPETTLLVTDRIAIRIFVNTDGNRTINLHTQDSHLSTVGTTFTRGLTAINGLIKQVQFLAIGNAGSDAAIVSSDDTHTINLPTASATKRGLLNSTDWSTFNAKQPALSGDGFVKISGSTISYDNSSYQPLDGDLTAIGALAGTSGILKKTGANTWALDTTVYLSTTDAASTYQRLDKMVSNLLASDTEYPNSNAVLAALALKANAENPSFTGYMTIGGAYPKIYLTDSDNNPDYFIGNDDGYFRIYDQTNSLSRFYITNVGVSTFPGDVIVGSIAKSGGTASQFLKADGTVDSTTYATSASLADYLTSATAATTYQRLDKMVSNLLASDTEYPNSNAVLAKLALKADAANPSFTGSMNISGAESRVNFYDENAARKYYIGYDSGFLRIYQDAGSASRFYINSSGKTFIPGILEVGTIIKTSGTASQFLKADGTVDSNTYVSSTALADYLLSATAATTYQRLDKMVSNLLASDTEYPNSNAVIAALALKANAANPTFTGNFTISGDSPKLYFVDTDNNPDYTLFTDSGYFYIYDQTAGATKFQITPSGNAINAGTLTSASFIKSGGTSSQFLKADGTVDSNTYLTSYTETDTLATVTARGATTTVAITVNSADWNAISTNNGSGLTTPKGAFFANAYPSTTDRYYAQFSGNWASSLTWGLGVRGTGDDSIYFARNTSGVLDVTSAIKLYVGPGLVLHTSNYSTYALPKTGGALTGNLTFSTQGSKIIFGDSTSASPSMIGEGLVDTEGTDSDFLTIYFRNSLRVYSQLSEIGRFTNAGLRVYGSIIKDGGTSSQFLKADGSVDSNTYLTTGTASSTYLPLSGGTMSGAIRLGDGIAIRDSGGDWMLGKNGTDVSLGSQAITNTINFNSLTATTFAYRGSAILHASNYGSYALPLAGGTMTGVLTGSGSGTFYIYNYGRIGLPNAGRIIYNNGTGSNMFFGEIATDVYGFTGNLYSDTPTIAMNLSSKSVTINGNSPTGKLTIQSSADGNMFSIRGFISAYGYPNVIEMGVTGADGYLKLRDGAGNVQTSISGYSGTPNYFLSKVLVGATSSIQGGPFGMFNSRQTTASIPAIVTAIDATSSTADGTILIGNLTTSSSAYRLISGYSGNGSTDNFSVNQFYVRGDGYAYFKGSVNTAQYRIFANGTANVYNIVDADQLYAGAYSIQAGGGSAGYGGSLVMYGHSHASRAGYVSAGISSGSNGKFTVMNGGNGSGSDIFTVSSNGNVAVSGITYADGGINMGSSKALFRFGGNTTPTLGHNIGGSDTGNTLFIEVCDSDTGGLCIQNDGVTVYGAGDAGFVFRVIDEDSFQGGGGAEANTCFKVNQGAGGGGYIKGDFTMTGSAYANAFYESSDSRLKVLKQDDIQVKGIENLKAKLYSKNGRLEYGYYAQEAETYIPSAVTVGTDGYLNLSYREVHTAKIARLENRVAELEKQLNIA